MNGGRTPESKNLRDGFDKFKLSDRLRRFFSVLRFSASCILMLFRAKYGENSWTLQQAWGIMISSWNLNLL